MFRAVFFSCLRAAHLFTIAVRLLPNQRLSSALSVDSRSSPVATEMPMGPCSFMFRACRTAALRGPCSWDEALEEVYQERHVTWWVKYEE